MINFKDVNAYKDNGKYYLDLRGEVRNGPNIHEIHIPKVYLGLEQARLLTNPHAMEEDLSIDGSWYTHCPSNKASLLIPTEELPLCESTAYFYNSDGIVNRIPNIYYAEKIRAKEMTISDIEKELGYKIIIVDEKENR